ncbi:MAG: CRISPR-associated protein Csm5 [Thermoprotei archaeon]
MIKESFTIEVSPITPVFVWSGETLYRGADFELVGERLIVADPFKAMGKVKALSDVFREEFAREVRGFKLVFSTPSTSPAPDRILMINENLIPASTVKGLIRTAVLSRMVNKDVYEEVRSNLEELMRLPKHQIPKRVKEVGGPVELLLKRRLQFGRGTYNYDAFSRLLISDPEVKGFSLSLRLIKVSELVGSFSTQAYAITLDRGTLTYDVKVVQPQNYGVNAQLKALDDLVNKDAIVSALKAYSERVVSSEKEKLKAASKFQEYRKFLDTLKVEGNCFPVKVGMFTGHKAKTIPLPPDLESLRSKVMTKVTEHFWDDSTVKLIDSVGVGWARLCVG